MNVIPRRPLGDLTGKQRRYLRGLAHALKPLVQVGKEGVTEGVIDAATAALDDHELIKLRVLEGAPRKRADTAEELALGTGSHVAGQSGRVVILYRMPERDPQIRLPSRDL